MSDHCLITIGTAQVMGIIDLLALTREEGLLSSQKEFA
jgi:hypothetical protein